MLRRKQLSSTSFSTLSALVLFAGASSAARADATGQWQFTINQAQSGLNATLQAGVQTSGTLIGDWDAAANPTGTRTKPGLSGSFGNEENVAVNVDNFDVGLDETINTDTSGAFSMDIDQTLGTVQLSNYTANFLTGGDLSLPIGVTIQYESFRSRSPSSIYPGGIPITLPIGNATVSALSFAQSGPGIGTITPGATPNVFDVQVIALAQLTLTVDILGQSFDIPQAPTPIALGGELVVNGSNATLSALRPIAFVQGTQPNQALPQFALPLPTVLPPGGIANVLLDLNLTDISGSLNGTFTTVSNGTLIPSPSTGPLLGISALACHRRRRGSKLS
jgi:hypothetical protein